MSTRIAERFAACAKEGRPALVTFVMSGDPDPATSEKILAALPGAGADIIEFGMPFSDPMADGPGIQLAGQRALASGQTLHKTLDQVKRFRAMDADTPVVLMGYYNPIYIYGVESFLADAVAAGVDGLIVVDLPPEEDAKIPTVCHSLDQALDALDKDRDFLKVGGVMCDDFIDGYIALKMQEVTKFRAATHPMEYQLYYSL